MCIRDRGYESKPIVNAAHFQPAPAESQDSGKHARQIILALSAVSPPDSIAMIVVTEPVLAAAGYDLVVIVIPADPVAARERLSLLLHEGIAGMVCCSSIYPVVSAMVAKGCPVIVLWQGAGKAMVGAIQVGRCQEAEGRGRGAERSGQLADQQPCSSTTPGAPCTK